MRQRIITGLLLIGTFVGYGAGFASLRHGLDKKRAVYEQHVAYVCAEAARHPEAAPVADTKSCDW
ncbi:MAG TPA: hypothetical protein VGM56_25750 [Byssovorax sp.]|jgi:hypothetical protein